MPANIEAHPSGTTLGQPAPAYRSPIWVLAGFGMLLLAIILYGFLSR